MITTNAAWAKATLMEGKKLENARSTSNLSNAIAMKMLKKAVAWKMLLEQEHDYNRQLNFPRIDVDAFELVCSLNRKRQKLKWVHSRKLRPQFMFGTG